MIVVIQPIFIVMTTFNSMHNLVDKELNVEK